MRPTLANQFGMFIDMSAGESTFVTRTYKHRFLLTNATIFIQRRHAFFCHITRPKIARRRDRLEDYMREIRRDTLTVTGSESPGEAGGVSRPIGVRAWLAFVRSANE